MAITITSAVVHGMHVSFLGGVATEMVFDYTYTDSNGAVGNAQYRKAPTTAQQTNIDNFLTGLITQFQTDTNLTITIG